MYFQREVGFSLNRTSVEKIHASMFAMCVCNFPIFNFSILSTFSISEIRYQSRTFLEAGGEVYPIPPLSSQIDFYTTSQVNFHDTCRHKRRNDSGKFMTRL